VPIGASGGWLRCRRCDWRVLVLQIDALSMFGNVSVCGQEQGSAWAVMARVHSGGGMAPLEGLGRGRRPMIDSSAVRGMMRGEEGWLSFGEREDVEFDADLAGPPSRNEIDVAAEAAADMIGGGWRKFGEAVGVGAATGRPGRG